MIQDMGHPPCTRCHRAAPEVTFMSSSGAVCLECIHALDRERAALRAAQGYGPNRPTVDDTVLYRSGRNRLKLREYSERYRQRKRAAQQEADAAAGESSGGSNS